MNRETLPNLTSDEAEALSRIGEADIARCKAFVASLKGFVVVAGERLSAAFLRQLWTAEDSE